MLQQPPTQQPAQEPESMLAPLSQPQGGTLLDVIPPPLPEGQAPLDDAAIQRRAAIHAIANISSVDPETLDWSPLERAYNNRKTAEEIIRIEGDTALRRKDHISELESATRPLSLIASDLQTPDAGRTEAINAMTLHYMNQEQERERMQTEQKFVKTVQGLLETGNAAEAHMISQLYRTPTAWNFAVKRQADYHYMQKAIEDAGGTEENRFFLFKLVDLAMLGFIPLLSSTANTGNVDNALVKKGMFDDLLSGDRLRNEVWAVWSIQDDGERRKAIDQLAKNLVTSTTDFGYYNQTQHEMLKEYFLNGPPSALETNIWDTIDVVLAPFVIHDIIAAGKGVRAIGKGTIDLMTRSGLRTDAGELVQDVAQRIKDRGAPTAFKETGVTQDAVEDAMLPSGLDPNSNPYGVSLSGPSNGVDDLTTLAARRLLGDTFPVSRLNAEELEAAKLKVGVQAKKDFGRHVHDVDFETIKLVNGSVIQSPTVVLGTTKDSLFVSRKAALDAISEMGMESATLEEIASPLKKAVDGKFNNYSVATEDNGTIAASVKRYPDGSVVIIDDKATFKYPPEFANGKSDDELLAYSYEPAGFQGATQGNAAQADRVKVLREQESQILAEIQNLTSGTAIDAHVEDQAKLAELTQRLNDTREEMVAAWRESKQAATAEAVAEPVAIGSENGVLYGIRVRLPLSESQFYGKITDTKPKNFIWRFLLGSRQTSSEETYGLSELVTARRQKVVKGIEREVTPLFEKLNNAEKNMMRAILIKSEKDQTWFAPKDLSVLYARLSGVGDDIHEITDTAISLGDIASPSGKPFDAEFEAEKAFLNLKDRSAELGKQVDEILKNSGEADEAKFWENAPPEARAVMDELTSVNAQIAKGVQPVKPPEEIETFLEPHTYQQWRAAEPTGEPPAGTVRVYHGGSEATSGGARWVTTNLEDAKGWAARDPSMKIWYTYVDETDPRIFTPGEGAAEGFAPRERFEVTEEEAATFREFKEGVAKFPAEHEDLWHAMDGAAEAAMREQQKATDQAMRASRRAAKLQMVAEERKAHPILDKLLRDLRGGVATIEIARRADGTRVSPAKLYGFVDRDELKQLALSTEPLDPLWGPDLNGVRVLELPGKRYVAWAGHEDMHENILDSINKMLEDRGGAPIAKGDTKRILVSVSPNRDGDLRIRNVQISEPTDLGTGDVTWVHSSTQTFGDFAREVDTYSATGPQFDKRVRQAASKADKTMAQAMSGGETTEQFRNAVDDILSAAGTKKITNASGQTLHTNRKKVMSKGLQYTPELDGFVPERFKRAYYKLVELSNIEHLLRNEDMYLSKAARGMETFSFVANRAEVAEMNGIVYRAGSLPSLPSSRIYNISDDVHHIADTPEDIRKGTALRLTSADIQRMIKKEGYIMVRSEKPITMRGDVTVQWLIGKASDFDIKPLKYEQLPYKAGPHRGYRDKHFAKQVRIGTQGDNGEQFLMSPSTFTIGTHAEVKAWAEHMETARAIWRNTEDPVRRMELLANHLDNKVGFPGAEEFADMVKTGKFNPDYPVEAVFDRENPSDYALMKTRGISDMSDEDMSGINTYMETHGSMYYSPKGDHMPDWRGQDATLIDPFTMMNRALSNIASMSSLADYKMRSIEKWVKTFGPYLDLKGLPKDASPVRIFHESVFLRDLPEAQRVKNSAEAQRDTIKRVLGWRSDVDREFEYMGRQLVDYVAGDKPGTWRNKTFSRGTEWVLEKNPVAKARKLAMNMKMGLGNVAQFPMQISTMFAVTALDVRGGIGAMFNIFPLKGYLSKSGDRAWLDLMIERGVHKMSGFDDPQDYIDMMEAAKKSGFFDIGGAHQLQNYHGVDAAIGAIGNGATGEILDTAGKAARWAGDKGLFFFNEAEVWNRIVGWQLAWKRMRNSGIPKGTSKFYERLMQSAADYTLNMSQAGAAAWQKGWASIPTQFLSYQARMLEAMLGKQFTTTQKIRLLLGQAVFYGAAGVPFAAFLAEKLRGESGEAPKLGTWEGLADRGLVDTIIWAATGGADVQYGERVATGSFVTDTFREMLGMSKYGEVSFTDVMGGPLYGISKDIGGSFWNIIRHAAAESGGDTGLPLTSAAVIDMARNVASFNNAYKAYMVWNYGVWLSKSGKEVIDELPSTDAFAVFLGLTPGEYRDYAAKQEWRKNRQSQVKEVSDAIISYRQRMAREPNNSTSISSQIEILRGITPQDIWIDALNKADASDTNDSIADALARQYETERQQQQLSREYNGR